MCCHHILHPLFKNQLLNSSSVLMSWISSQRAALCCALSDQRIGRPRTHDERRPFCLVSESALFAITSIERMSDILSTLLSHTNISSTIQRRWFAALRDTPNLKPNWRNNPLVEINDSMPLTRRRARQVRTSTLVQPAEQFRQTSFNGCCSASASHHAPSVRAQRRQWGLRDQ